MKEQKKPRARVAKVVELRIWGGAPMPKEKVMPGKLPNPFPTDIASLVILACTVRGLATPVFDILKSWIDDRKGRKITIKHSDLEVTIEGGVSKRQLRSVTAEFRKLTRGRKDKIKVILPRGGDHKLPNQANKERG